MKEVTIYTDGACSGNPGPGGWAALLMYNDKKKIISDGETLTTNNRMELIAVIKALSILKAPCKVNVYTDSKYVQQGASEWMHNWRLNNWHKGGKLIKNSDLWKELYEELKKHQVNFFWVKGHANNQENNLVDQLAREACGRFL